MSKILTVTGVSILAVALILGMALPASADPDITIPWTEDFDIRIVKGEVTYVDELNQAYFNILSGEDEISIRVDEDTKYFVLDASERIMASVQQWMRLRHQNQGELGIRQRLMVSGQLAQAEDTPVPALRSLLPPHFGIRAEFSDIEVGDRVVVFLANGENLAKVVLIIKPVTIGRISGVITDLSSTTIEITPDDGSPVTLRYNEDTVFILHGFTSVQERQLARAVYDSEHMLAQRVVVYLPGD